MNFCYISIIENKKTENKKQNCARIIKWTWCLCIRGLIPGSLQEINHPYWCCKIKDKYDGTIRVKRKEIRPET